MKKESIIIFGASLLISIAIVGGVYYMTVVRQPVPAPEQESGSWGTLTPRASQPVGATANPNVSAEPSSKRTDTPIKCLDPEVGEFWTNAATCEGADLYNRMSIAEPLVDLPERERYSNKSYQTPQESAKQNRSNTGANRQVAAKKPNLRLMGKSPPDGLSVSCKFSVGKALELERALSAKDDPGKSIWKEDYCEWRKKARDEDCDVPSDLYYYNNLCPYGW